MLKKVIASAAIMTCCLGGPADAMPSYNTARNGGTTLQQKCRALIAAQNELDFGRMMQLGFQIGFEHDVPAFTTPKQDCESVGVYGVY